MHSTLVRCMTHPAVSWGSCDAGTLPKTSLQGCLEASLQCSAQRSSCQSANSKRIKVNKLTSSAYRCVRCCHTLTTNQTEAAHASLVGWLPNKQVCIRHKKRRLPVQAIHQLCDQTRAVLSGPEAPDHYHSCNLPQKNTSTHLSQARSGNTSVRTATNCAICKHQCKPGAAQSSTTMCTHSDPVQQANQACGQAWQDKQLNTKSAQDTAAGKL